MQSVKDDTKVFVAVLAWGEGALTLVLLDTDGKHPTISRCIRGMRQRQKHNFTPADKNWPWNIPGKAGTTKQWRVWCHSPKSPVGESDYLLDIFEAEVEVEYRGERYRARDNGAVFRLNEFRKRPDRSTRSGPSDDRTSRQATSI